MVSVTGYQDVERVRTDARLQIVQGMGNDIRAARIQKVDDATAHPVFAGIGAAHRPATHRHDDFPVSIELEQGVGRSEGQT